MGKRNQSGSASKSNGGKPRGASGKGGRAKGGLLRSGRLAIQHQIQSVQHVRQSLNSVVEVVAFWLGLVGFLGAAVVGLYWGWITLFPENAIIDESFFGGKRIIGSFVVCLLAASCMGWLLVNDGQGHIERRGGRAIAVLLFGVLPMICLVSSLFPAKLSEFTGLPPIESEPNHPYWLWVRFYPISLIAVALLVAFKYTAQPRKYVKKARAAKFLIMASPYVAVLLVQEVSLFKAQAMEDALQSTLGNAGVNVHLIMAVLTSSRID